jgi:putative oxidoreductase
MNVLHQIERWSVQHNPRWLIIFRVGLGLCLFIRGISFISNIQLLQQQIENSSLKSLNDSFWLAPIIISWIHILGGVLITLGLFTRPPVLVQIPIVLGAIIFINSRNIIYPSPSELVFSAFVFLLLIVFAIEGGGEISMDNYVKRHLL